MGFGFARVRIKGIRISEGLLYYFFRGLVNCLGVIQVFVSKTHTHVTGFAKTGLIAGVRNCSYNPFWSAKSIFFDFIFS